MLVQFRSNPVITDPILWFDSGRDQDREKALVWTLKVRKDAGGPKGAVDCKITPVSKHNGTFTLAIMY